MMNGDERIMQYDIVEVGAFEVNCIVAHDGCARGVIVDPGGDAGRIGECVARLGVVVEAVWLTHRHIDHVAALDEVLRMYPGVPVMLHAEDVEWTFSPLNRIPPYMTVPKRPASLRVIGEGDILGVGKESVRVLSTPGHSPGSVCFLDETGTLMFSGDTLFCGGMGRTDLPGGDVRLMRESLNRLRALDPSIRVIPGHGPETTIEDERR